MALNNYENIKRPNLIISIAPYLQYSRTPEYLGSLFNISNNYISSIPATLRSNFSDKFNFSTKYNISYLHTDNSITSDNKAFRHTFSLTGRYEKGRFFIASSFDYSYYDGQIAAPSYGRNSLNAICGIKLFRKHNGQLSISAYDILNNASRISTKVNAQGITTIRDTNYQRMITLNFYYKFRQSSQ